MKVNTAELKTHLGRYLQLVRKGETVEVTSHAHPVAKIIPYGGRTEPSLIKPTRPVQDLQTIKGIQTRKGADGVDALLEDRGTR